MVPEREITRRTKPTPVFPNPYPDITPSNMTPTIK
jgi:hypothetical protein